MHQMTDSKSGKSYELEPHEADEGRSHDAPAADSTGQGEAGASSVESLDVCPNCGASLGDVETLVCIRCGYDLKNLQVVETKTESEAAEAEDEEEEDEAQEQAGAITQPGRGGLRLPLILAAISAGILVIAHLAGSRGLYTVEEIPGFGGRLLGTIQGLTLVVIGTLCGLGGLWAVARYVQETTFGDLWLAGARMLGIVATARLIAMLDVPVPVIGWVVEFAGQGMVFALLTMWFFSLKVMDAVATTVVALALLAAGAFAALIVGWAV